MGKKVRAAAGAVMLSLGMAWVPWIVVGPLAVLVLLLVFVAALAFCDRGEPTRRVIALVRAVKAPVRHRVAATARGRSHPATRSLGAGCGQLGWPSPCTPDPSPLGWCRSGHRPHPPSWPVATPRTGRPCLIIASARSVPPGPGRAGKWSCPLGRRRQRRAHAGLWRPGKRSAAR